MQIRRPSIDFSQIPVHWSHHREFSQVFNASSTNAPHVEPYLNRVVAQAKKLLPVGSPLAVVIDEFIQQESNHYRLHIKYNQSLFRKYPQIESLSNEIKEDYARFLKTKSLKFNLAYSVGFETVALTLCQYFFEAIDDLLVNADKDALMLWRWHLAEEYEHRSVCFDVYKAVYGNYFYRIYGLIFSVRHLKRHSRKITAALLEEDRKGMTDAERAASIERANAYRKRNSSYIMPRLLRLFSPWYDPSTEPPPRGVEAVLLATSAPQRPVLSEVSNA